MGTDRASPASVHLLLWGVMGLWGLNIPVVKVLTGALETVWVAALRMTLAAVVLSAIVVMRQRGWPRMNARQWGVTLLAGALSVYANQILFAAGLGRTTSTHVSLVMALTPSMALVAGALAFGEPIGRRVLVGIAAGFAGVALVTLTAPGAHVGMPGAGELLVLLGLAVFVAGGLFIQKLSRELDALVVGWGVHVGGALMLGLHAAAAGGTAQALGALAAPEVAACLLYSGLFGSALSIVVWYRGVARIGVGAAFSFFYALPIFGTAFSALLLGEELTVWHGLGLALVVLGTRLGSGAVGAAPAGGR